MTNMHTTFTCVHTQFCQDHIPLFLCVCLFFQIPCFYVFTEENLHASAKLYGQTQTYLILHLVLTLKLMCTPTLLSCIWPVSRIPLRCLLIKENQNEETKKIRWTPLQHPLPYTPLLHCIPALTNGYFNMETHSRKIKDT